MRLWWIGIGLWSACGSSEDDPVDAGRGDDPTWHQDVAPLVAGSCTQCHASDGIASFLDLTQYDDAVSWAPAIRAAVSGGTMPPFLAVESDVCENRWGFLHDARLTVEEIDTVVTWVDAGAPEGDAATAAALPSPDVPVLEQVDQELVPRSIFQTTDSATLLDEIVCVVLDPALSETSWLEALQVVPDNVAVVHHVLLNVASRSDAEAADAADGSVDGAYDCLGGVNLPGARLVGGWIPGGGATEYPEQSGFEVGTDQVFVAQMHYHNVAEPQQDATTVQVRWADGEPEYVTLVELYGNAQDASEGLLDGPNDAGPAEFRVPAGVAGHVETSRHELPIPEGVEVDVFMVAPHMHYAGVGVRAWLEHADGSDDDCLVHVPKWDFDWQLLYFYDASSRRAPVAKAGDRLVIECSYDNTADNAGLMGVLQENGLSEPTDLVLGEGSLDEMCLVGVGAVIR